MPLSALVPMSGCCDQRPCPGSRNRRTGVSGRWRRGRGYTRGSAVGAFGPGLYADDFAADLRTTVSTVCRLPLSRPELVATLEALEPAAAMPEDEDYTTFWLVVADQLHRRGIRSGQTPGTCRSEKGTRSVGMIRSSTESLQAASEGSSSTSSMRLAFTCQHVVNVTRADATPA